VSTLALFAGVLTFPQYVIAVRVGGANSRSTNLLKFEHSSRREGSVHPERVSNFQKDLERETRFQPLHATLSLDPNESNRNSCSLPRSVGCITRFESAGRTHALLAGARDASRLRSYAQGARAAGTEPNRAGLECGRRNHPPGPVAPGTADRDTWFHQYAQARTTVL
jgi:hypothetical protein